MVQSYVLYALQQRRAVRTTLSYILKLRTVLVVPFQKTEFVLVAKVLRNGSWEGFSLNLIKRLFRFVDSLSVVGVDGVDDPVALGVVLVPQGLELFLPTQVPEVEPKINGINSLNVVIGIGKIGTCHQRRYRGSRLSLRTSRSWDRDRVSSFG